MQIPYVFGLDYETASFEIREAMAFSEDIIPDAISRIITAGLAKEVIILSTCNRTEIYCITQDIDFVINAVCDIKNLCPRTVKKYSYVYSGVDCANHLFRVVSGLESMVLGETEIVYQVKSALSLAKTANGVSASLSGLFQMALSVEKEVRSETAINGIAVSMGNAVVNLVAVNTDDFTQEKILFIGAGQIMQQIAPHFKNTNFLDQPSWVAGIYGSRDHLNSKLGNKFGETTIGFEALSNKYDFRVNLYIPDKGPQYRFYRRVNNGADHHHMNHIDEYYITEEALPGADFEVGYRLPITQVNSKFFAGYYYFDGKHRYESIYGPRFRAEAKLDRDNLRFLPRNLQITFGGEYQYDDARGSIATLTAMLTYQFGKIYESINHNKNDLRNRMNEFPVRDVDIVTGKDISVFSHKEHCIVDLDAGIDCTWHYTSPTGNLCDTPDYADEELAPYGAYCDWSCANGTGSIVFFGGTCPS